MHDLVAVNDRLAGNHLEAFEQLLRLVPAVCFNQADDYVTTARFFAAGRREHGVGLADAGRGAEENLEMPSTLSLGQGEQCIRRSSLVCHFSGHSAPRGSKSTTSTRQVRD